MTTTKYTATGRDARLKEIAAKMKTAKGAALEALSTELNKAIGFDEGKHDPERLANWELSHGGREP